MSAPLQGRSPALDARRRWVIVGAILLLAAFAIRCVQFGNPLIHVDENFYLLVGDRMLHGAVPYVDIWDRKPVGLFVLFAAIRLLGGDGIVQYQVVATLFAAGTALIIARMAAPMAGLKAATVAGVIYLLLLGLVGGSGGQKPVFYNLFVAGAALATMTAMTSGVDPAGRTRTQRPRRHGPDRAGDAGQVHGGLRRRLHGPGADVGVVARQRAARPVGGRRGPLDRAAPWPRPWSPSTGTPGSATPTPSSTPISCRSAIAPGPRPRSWRVAWARPGSSCTFRSSRSRSRRCWNPGDVFPPGPRP